MSSRDIAKHIRTLAGDQPGKKNIFAARVAEVDGRQCSVIPLGGHEDATVMNVRLNGEPLGEKGLLITPVKDSVVLVGRLSEHDHAVLMYSEIEKIELLMEDFQVEIDQGIRVEAGSAEMVQDADGFVFKTSDESLKAWLERLVDAIGQITVPTGVGPSGMPVNAANFSMLKTDLSKLLKE